MPRYLVQRSFPDGFEIPPTDEGAATVLGMVERNNNLGVTWIHSYVAEDRRSTFCLYEGPTPEAIRAASKRNGLSVDKITEIRMFDPFSYR